MTEGQHTEWKSSWRDEYLKSLCGFANAQGGVLEIGRDDKGRIVGLENARRLLEELPNKLRDLLGIVADIELLEEDGKPYLRIAVEPYPVPISYRGEYHYRSGSTNQMLRGGSLDRFLLRKHGRTWDGVPLPGMTPADLDAEALKSFRQLAACRLSSSWPSPGVNGLPGQVSRQRRSATRMTSAFSRVSGASEARVWSRSASSTVPPRMRRSICGASVAASRSAAICTSIDQPNLPAFKLIASSGS